MSQEYLNKFVSIRERVGSQQVLSPVIESSLLSLLSSEREELFQLALLVWNTAFNTDALEELLSAVSQENDSQEEREEIKLIRKQGVILESAYSYFDSRRAAPTHHNYVMKQIGVLNDPVSANKFLKAKSRAIAATSKYNSVVRLDYNPESDQKYQVHILVTLENLRKTFQKPLLFLPEFHTARKELRKVMNLLQIRAVLRDDETAYAELSNWFILNTQLGKINDNALIDSSGKKGQYKSMTIKLDPQLVSQVLEQLFCLSKS